MLSDSKLLMMRFVYFGMEVAGGFPHIAFLSKKLPELGEDSPNFSGEITWPRKPPSYSVGFSVEMWMRVSENETIP